MDVSKATIYKYRNLENVSDIPKDKRLKILYLFGKATEEEKETLASLEELTAQNERLRQKNASLLGSLKS